MDENDSLSHSRCPYPSPFHFLITYIFYVYKKAWSQDLWFLFFQGFHPGKADHRSNDNGSLECMLRVRRL